MIEIYGKESCNYCTKAKTLCEMKGIEYVYKMLDEDYTQDEFFSKFPRARTFPQIIANEQVLGGFEQLEKYFENN
jgi:glutaredoxin